MRWLLLLVVSLAGCAAEPVAPTIIREPVEVEIAVPVKRQVPDSLKTPISVAVPDIAETGDYCLSRAGFETLIDAAEALHERIRRWEAWAIEE